VRPTWKTSRMSSVDIERSVMSVPQKPNIYSAKIGGYNFLDETYNERWGITWPCGQLEYRAPTELYELGDMIAEHMNICSECEYYANFRDEGRGNEYT
jgi:hypothetical protein